MQKRHWPPSLLLPATVLLPPSGKVIGARELQLMVEASLDGWLTTGRFNDAFEKKLGEYMGVPYVLTTTSGSSANLLALTALTSHKLGAKALKPGDDDHSRSRLPDHCQPNHAFIPR